MHDTENSPIEYLLAKKHREEMKGKKEISFIVPQDATNGDMMKALFPDTFTNRDKLREPDMINLCSNDGIINVKAYEDWWNAPYKTESEDKE